METKNWKFIKFDQYCHRCEHEDLKEKESPCAECLDIGARLNNSEPEYFKEKENGTATNS